MGKFFESKEVSKEVVCVALLITNIVLKYVY